MPANNTDRQTLEQKRAADAWKCAENCDSEYVSVAKGLPALIMNSGLMQVMAFMHEKQGTHEVVAQQLRRWLVQRHPSLGRNEFGPFMLALMNAQPQQYRDVTTEAFAWLRWLRQLAAARVGR